MVCGTGTVGILNGEHNNSQPVLTPNMSTTAAWPLVHNSNFDAVVTPRVSFLEDCINSKPESGTGWVGHQALPLEAGFPVLFVRRRQE